MISDSREQPLPDRVEDAFSEVLTELEACGHQPPRLLARAGLPRWCRRSLFFFLGYIAKSDGRVTEADVRYAEDLIKALKLNASQRQRAIGQFQKGKASKQLPALKAMGLRFSRRWWPTPALTVALCLCHAAQLHGKPRKPRRYRCEDAVDYMGLDVRIVEEVLESYACKVWQEQPEFLPAPQNYDEACKVLGITRRDSLKTVKQTYRKRVSTCHPDKLAHDASASEQAQAKERLLRYQQAWELVRRHHQH